MFIPERQREALMRLTMCARDECMMCIYSPKDDRCKDIATTAMHILANALKVDDADTPQTDCGWKQPITVSVMKRKAGKSSWDHSQFWITVGKPMGSGISPQTTL